MHHWVKLKQKQRCWELDCLEFFSFFVRGLKLSFSEQSVTQKILVKYANLYDLRLSLLLRIWRSYKSEESYHCT